MITGVIEEDIWIFKLSENGDFKWQKAYDFGGVEESLSIQETMDNGCIVTGITRKNNSSEAWILKLGIRGKILWQRILMGFRHSQFVRETNKGNYIVAGHFKRPDVYQDDIGILLFGQDGTLLWQKAYGGEKRDMAYCIQPTIDGGFILAGESESIEGHLSGAANEELLVVKLNHQGDIQWQKLYGGDYSLDGGRAILQTMDGGYIVAGKTMSWGAGNCDAWILKLDANGEINPLCKFIKPAKCEVFDSKIKPAKQQVKSRKTDAKARKSFGIVEKVTGKIYRLGEGTNIKLTIASESSGTTDPPTGTYYYSSGSLVKIYGFPNTNFHLAGWAGNVQIESVFSDLNPLELNLDGNKTIIAVFKRSWGSEWSGGGGGGGIKSIRITDNPEASSVVVVSAAMLVICILFMIYLSLYRKKIRDQ